MRYKSLVIAVFVVLMTLLTGQGTFAKKKQAGCLGKVKSNVLDAKLYRWPAKVESEMLLDLGPNKFVRVYTEYVSPTWYLAKVNTGNPSRPINGFVEISKINRGSSCFSHKYLHTNRALRSGAEYIVRSGVESIYLRDADGKNHAIGLMRAGDIFIRHERARDGNQLLGWAMSRGVNPRFRYGSVLVSRRRKDGRIDRFLELKR